jgi:ribonuclease P protein component
MHDYPKAARLLKPADFRAAYDGGERLACSLFVAFARCRGDQDPARFGFTCPRALGKAHDRNRIKRRLRECVRLRKDRFPAGLDLVFNPRKSLLGAAWGEIERQVEKLLDRLSPCESSSLPS